MNHFEFLEKNEKEIISFIQRLVQTPSQNGVDPEIKIAKIVAQKLTDFGLKPEFIGDSKRPSILFRVGSGKKSLLLDAPLDTVPAGDPNRWKYPPFSGKIINGKLYGRGSADCKSAIAIFCFIAAALKEDFKGNLILTFDSNEQSGEFTGIKEILKVIQKPNSAMIGYPGTEEIAIGARGFLRLEVKTLGKPAHTGSRTSKGINAISKMNGIISALEELKLKGKVNKFFPFGAKITISQIEGGRAINLVPDECKIKIDIRTLPEQTKEEILDEIKNLIQNLQQKDKDLKAEIKPYQFVPAFLTQQEEKIVAIFHRNAQKILKRKILLTAYGGSGIGNEVAQLGVPVIGGFGVDCDNIHAYNEYIVLNTILPVAKIYTQTIIDFFK